jgi:micrococcal nuclease
VVDGDTVLLRDVGTVRLIGIDTPETVDPRVPVQAFGIEATSFLRQMVEGQVVRLEYDTQRFDKYHRTLAYLYLPDGSFVNLEMVRQGYANAYLDYPFRYMKEFRSAEREAREAGRGLWGPHTTAQSAVSAVSAPVRVWVNTASRVYHCPGTRYYGSTARGEYMTESEAQQNGNRAAYGRACGPVPASTSAAEAAAPAPPAPSAATKAGVQRTEGSVKVWVNISSRVYHCPGARYYGNTKNGTYMSESEAQSRGYRAAYGRACS